LEKVQFLIVPDKAFKAKLLPIDSIYRADAAGSGLELAADYSRNDGALLIDQTSGNRPANLLSMPAEGEQQHGRQYRQAYFAHEALNLVVPKFPRNESRP
jgi:hypothetical protein